MCEENDIFIKTSRARKIWIYVNLSARIRLYTFFQYLMQIKNYITGNQMLTTVIHIFEHLKASTVVSNVYGIMRRILYLIVIAPRCNMTMPLVQHRMIKDGPFILSLIFERRIIINNGFISNFLGVVYYFTIFAYIIFINLRLIFMTY